MGPRVLICGSWYKSFGLTTDFPFSLLSHVTVTLPKKTEQF